MCVSCINGIDSVMFLVATISQLFIFDVDATLVNTTQVINNIWKTWALQKNIEFSDIFPHVHGL